MLIDSQYHIPVLLNEVVNYLGEGIDNNEQFTILDLTFGGGGHSFTLLNKFKNAKVIGFDQDIDAIEHGHKFAKQFGFESRLTLINKNFSELDNFLNEAKDVKLDQIKIILADIGVSSFQFDTPERGFSFRYDAPLDMRMNKLAEVDASYIVNETEEDELADIFFKYGDEKLSRKISRKITEHKKNIGAIKTTKELENIIFHSYPPNMRYAHIHPATRVFQALRIAVNKELDVLESLIKIVSNLELQMCRFGIITFHSLEDRIVKNCFRDLSKTNKKYRLITKKSVPASDEEIKLNSRSRSAKLRVISISSTMEHV